MVSVLALGLLLEDEEAKTRDVEVSEGRLTLEPAFKFADEGSEALFVPGDGVRTEVTRPVGRLEEVERLPEADARLWLALPQSCRGVVRGHPRLLVHTKRRVLHTCWAWTSRWPTGE
jgi:hypothetical protein